MPIFEAKKIVVAFDFSKFSIAAWRFARGLAKQFGSSLEVVYVQEEYPAQVWPSLYKPLNNRFRREIASSVRSKIGDPEIPVHIFEGDPVVALLDFAQTHRPELIVMGTSGRAGLRHALLGSVAEAVVRLSPVPVLVVRGAFKPVRTILAPVNFTEYAQEGFLFAVELAAALRSRVTALYVAADAAAVSSASLQLSELVEKLPVELRKNCALETQVLEDHAARGILEASRRHDLLVLAAHKKPLLNDLVLGMTAERVIRHSRIPVLAVPSSKPSKSRARTSALRALEKVVSGKVY